MIRTLTVVESIVDGKSEYTANGDLPLDTAAGALVVIAFNAKKPDFTQLPAA